MVARRLALGAAAAAAAFWTAKAVAIGLAGGLDKSPAEGPLFALGMVSALVGAGALGVHVVGGRSTPLRVLGAVGGVAALILVAMLTGWVVALAEPEDPAWVWGEVNLWVSALVLLVAATIAPSRAVPTSVNG